MTESRAIQAADYHKVSAPRREFYVVYDPDPDIRPDINSYFVADQWDVDNFYAACEVVYGTG